MSNRYKLLEELLENQLEDVPFRMRRSFKDLKRMCRFIKFSIFTSTECVLWSGFITNISKNSHKGIYVNFYFNKNKQSLHRILWNNFRGPIKDHYISYLCSNKGQCLNLNHMKSTAKRIRVQKTPKLIPYIHPFKNVRLENGNIVVKFE